MPNYTMKYKVVERVDETFDVCEVIFDRKEVIKKFDSRAEAEAYMADELGQEIPVSEGGEY